MREVREAVETSGGGRTGAGEIRRFAARWSAHADARGAEAGGDFVRSPAGLWLALGVVAAGARGETAEEIRQLLGVAEGDAARAVGAVSRALAGTDALGLATCVWSRVPVYREFQETLPDVAVGRLDPAAVDAWVREATDGMIERLPVRIGDDTLLAVVNALALKARWEDPFPRRRTADRDFTDAAGTRHRVPTMHKGVPLADIWTVGATRVAELRCRSGHNGPTGHNGLTGHDGPPGSDGPAAPGRGGGPARVRFLLGPEGAGPADVLPAGWAPPGERTPPAADRAEIALPRLSLRTTVEVTGELPGWGIRRATTGLADFSGLSPEPLALSRVVQEAVLEIAEEGVEAAAVSVVPMAPGAAPPPPRRTETLRFARPFGIVVLDEAGEVPLFIAWQEEAPCG
ncbi:serpin family protein [Streptomyces sp. NPDC058657]|uniref:serpin family protein n=1 Tax=unclassified Streptomyces TaxID=2593676 RepID=UPI003666EBCA